MRVVVADTGPLHYLVLIGHIDILPALFQTIFIPSVVRDEMAHEEAPTVVRQWISNPPQWLEVRANVRTEYTDAAWLALDQGEQVALALAASISAELVLMDDRAGFRVAI